MARVTVEDCLEKVDNRFLLVMLAAKRVKQLYKGAKPQIENKGGNKNVVMSLREIAAGKVKFELRGGTDVAWAMPVDYLANVFVPHLRKFADITIGMTQRGYGRIICLASDSARTGQAHLGVGIVADDSSVVL